MRFFSAVNLPITIPSLFLLSIGILVIFSSSPQLAFQQAIFAFVGLILYFFISQFDYRVMKNFIFLFYIIVFLLLLVVLILGIETRGSVRWIPLGFLNIQPSELAKPALILFLADFWRRNSPSFKNILKSFLFSIPLLFLVFRQPDLGSTLTLFAIWVGVVFACGISFKKILTISLIVLILIPMMWFPLRDYQKERIFGFLTPESDPLGRGYNLIQSTIAVGSGEFFGRGLGRGTQSRLQFLPEFRTDFIFASIAEELGFVGSILILMLYLFLFVSCMILAKQTLDLFGYLLIFGISTMLLFQTFVNIGMNVGLLPITGITLPLISYGGSSLISTFLCLGFVSSVAKYGKRNSSESVRVDMRGGDV